MEKIHFNRFVQFVVHCAGIAGLQKTGPRPFQFWQDFALWMVCERTLFLFPGEQAQGHALPLAGGAVILHGKGGTYGDASSRILS